jgi:hypothetical protein
MNPPAAKLFTRGRQLGFPSIVVAGLVCAGAPAWEQWLSRAGAPADLEQAAKQLDAFESRLHEAATRMREEAQDAVDRLEATALDERIGELIDELIISASPAGRVVPVDDPRMAHAPSGTPRSPGGLSPGYAGSPQEERDLEAAAALESAGP